MKKHTLFIALSLLFTTFAENIRDHVIRNLPNYSQSRFAGEFDRFNFDFDGTPAWIVMPNSPDPAKRWILRARFFGHQPQTDIEMLRRGYFLVFINVSNLYGNPRAVERWDKLYNFLTGKCGFSRKVILEGMSRGGLPVFNWAKKNPDKCAAIYVDAPVCDIRSWPCRKVNSADSERCLKAYSISRKDLTHFQGNPIDDLAAMAKVPVPVFAVCGENDYEVPMKDNINVFASRYRQLGGNIRIITKPGNGHHPHSLLDPSPIVNFLELHSRGSNDYAVSRAGMKKHTGAFTQIAFTGEADVKNYPDVVSAVNNILPHYSSDGNTKADMYIITADRNNIPDAEALEKIITNIRKNSPDAPVFLVYPGDDELIKKYIGSARPIHKGMITEKNSCFDNRRTAFSADPRIAAMEKIAEKYSCNSIDVSRDLAERKLHREFTDADFAITAAKVASEYLSVMITNSR